MLPTQKNPRHSSSADARSNTHGQASHPRLEALAQGTRAAIDKVKERAAEAKAAKEQAQREHDEQIRAEERQRITDEQKKARKQQYQHHVNYGNLQKTIGNYDEAIIQYYAALAVLNTKDKITSSDLILEALLGVNYKYNDLESATVLMNIAECYELKKDYVNALKCYEKLTFLGTPLALPGLQLSINRCKQQITTQLEAMLTAAENAQSSNNTAEANRQLTAATELAKKIRAENVLGKISRLQRRFTWETKRSQIVAGYEKLKAIDLANYTGEYDALATEVWQLIHTYEQNCFNPDTHDSQLFKDLNQLREQLRSLASNQKLQREWLAAKANLANNVARIASKNGNYPEFELATLDADLAKYCELYRKYTIFLGTEDQTCAQQANELYTTVHALHIQKLECDRRAAESNSNKQREHEINAKLDEVHQDLLVGAWETALVKLTSCITIAGQITKREDITNTRYLTANYFDSSIEKIRNHLTDFNASRDVDTVEQAKQLLEGALLKYADKNDLEFSSLQLLPRHAERLQAAITSELKAQWRKFYGKHESESKNLFETISTLIADNIIATTLAQRIGNLTGANVCLTKENDRSQTVPEDIKRMLRNHAASPVAYLQLPIMPLYTPRHSSAPTVPLATVVSPTTNSDTNVPAATVVVSTTYSSNRAKVG
jgi:hypothetical protein